MNKPIPAQNINKNNTADHIAIQRLNFDSKIDQVMEKTMESERLKTNRFNKTMAFDITHYINDEPIPSII